MQFTWLPFTCLAWLCVTAPCALATANNPPLDQLPTWFADESYYRTRFPCSLQERQCFMQEQLLYPENGECYAVGEQGPCATGRIFHADFAEAQRLGGHLRGSCGALCEDDTQAPFIATGQCLTRSQVEAQFCRSDWYLQPVKDAFGQWVCQWTYLPCKPFLNHRRGIVPHDQLLSAPYHGLCWPPDIFWRVAAGNLTAPADRLAPPLPAGHPLARAFGDRSYVGRAFACSDEERACLRVGRVRGADGRCYRTGRGALLCTGDAPFFYAVAPPEGGALRGTCLEYSPGNAPENPLCVEEWGMESTADPFGRVVCRCETPEEPSIAPTQPPAASPGLCPSPDFNHPVIGPIIDRTMFMGFSVTCSTEEHACLREGRVLAGGACHVLRTRGPCAEGEELVLDRHALAHARLQPACKARSCPEGRVLLSAIGECLTHQQVRSMICHEDVVVLDDFGGWHCIGEHYFLEWASAAANLAAIVRHAGNATCELAARPLF